MATLLHSELNAIAAVYYWLVFIACSTTGITLSIRLSERVGGLVVVVVVVVVVVGGGGGGDKMIPNMG